MRVSKGSGEGWARAFVPRPSNRSFQYISPTRYNIACLPYILQTQLARRDTLKM